MAKYKSRWVNPSWLIYGLIWAGPVTIHGTANLTQHDPQKISPWDGLSRGLVFHGPAHCLCGPSCISKVCQTRKVLLKIVCIFLIVNFFLKLETHVEVHIAFACWVIIFLKETCEKNYAINRPNFFHTIDVGE